MKRRFFTFLSLLLILSMLLPTLSSCFDIPDPNPDPDPDPDPEPEFVPEYEPDDVVHEASYYFTTLTVSTATSDDFKAVKDRWREQYIGSTDTTAEHSEEYLTKVQKISTNCSKAWSAYKTAGDKHFGYSIGGNAGDESEIADIYIALRSMAIGYATPGSTYYHNELLLKDIKNCLDYTYTNYYNETTSEYGNWWYWDIGIPMRMTIVLLLLEEELGKTAIIKYLKHFDNYNMYPSETAANRVWIGMSCLLSALLQEDGARLLHCIDDLNVVFNYVTSGDGFYADGSFVQHSAFAYTGGYGLSLIESLSEILYSFHDTKFDFTAKNVQNHYDWIMNSFAPLVYGGRLFASVRGREVSRETSEAEAGYTYIATLARMIGYAPKEYRVKFKSLLRSYMIAQNSNLVVEAGIDLCMADYCSKLLTNNGVKAVELIEGVTVFGNMDRVALHTKNYAACVSMSSTRIYKYESINNENMNGWFQGDGMLYIYTGNYDFDYNYFHYIDPYFLPGITRNSQLRTAVSIDNKSTIKGTSGFVGGLEAGKYGMAVYDHGYSSNNYYTSNIKARKTYFFFDNEIVCVGTGISDSSGTDVVTVIEGRKKVSSDVFTVDGSEKTLSASAKSYTADWAHFTGMGGYVFFETTTFYAKEYTNFKKFLEMYVSHGKNPTSSKYAYVLLPTATAQETEAYMNNMDVEIVFQSAKTHVVHEYTTGATAYAFYDAATAVGVTVSRNSCVFIIEEDGEKVIRISDPSFKRTSMTVKVTLDGETEVTSKDDNITASIDSNVLTLTLDMKGNVGGTYTVRVK